MNRWKSLGLAASAALLAMGLSAGSVMGQNVSGTATQTPLFDWSVNSGNGIAGTGNGGDLNGFTPSPVLTDSNVSQVVSFLAARHAHDPTLPLAVKVVGPISQFTAAQVFDNFNVKFVFADLESAQSISQFQTLMSYVHATGSVSKSAFVGNFNLYSGGQDGTDSGTAGGAASFQNNQGYNVSTFNKSGATMSNEEAYPGSPDYTSASAAGAPNIRSALFCLPIDRVTFATDGLLKGSYPEVLSTQPQVSPSANAQNIPWVARFNNWGNSLLNNDAGYQGYKYAFNTTSTAAPQYQNQLLSRGDFSAQVLQYRLRGATGINLFNYSQPYASVIGYSPAQEQQDALNGWTGGGNSTLAAIWGRSYAYANLVNAVPVLRGGAYYQASSVQTGMVLSGIYDTTGTGRQLALMLSNLSASSETFDFANKYGGYSVNLGSGLVAGNTGSLDQYYTIAPGTHDLLTFNLTNGRWVLFANDQIFADSNRSGIGVPEPTSVALLGMFGGSLLLRRRRRIEAEIV